MAAMAAQEADESKAQTMLSGFPGYTYPCPAGYYLPLTSWATVAWVGASALWVEAALLALGLLGFPQQRSILRGALAPLFVVIGCALIASAVAVWMGYRNTQLCFYTNVHYTPALGAQWERANATAIAQANIALAIDVALFLIGTFLTARILVLGWRGRRRASTTPAA